MRDRFAKTLYLSALLILAAVALLVKINLWPYARMLTMYLGAYLAGSFALWGVVYHGLGRRDQRRAARTFSLQCNRFKTLLMVGRVLRR